MAIIRKVIFISVFSLTVFASEPTKECRRVYNYNADQSHAFISDKNSSFLYDLLTKKSTELAYYLDAPVWVSNDHFLMSSPYGGLVKFNLGGEQFKNIAGCVSRVHAYNPIVTQDKKYYISAYGGLSRGFQMIDLGAERCLYASQGFSGDLIKIGYHPKSEKFFAITREHYPEFPHPVEGYYFHVYDVKNNFSILKRERLVKGDDYGSAMQINGSGDLLIHTSERFKPLFRQFDFNNAQFKRISYKDFYKWPQVKAAWYENNDLIILRTRIEKVYQIYNSNKDQVLATLDMQSDNTIYTFFTGRDKLTGELSFTNSESSILRFDKHGDLIFKSGCL